jgi:hypothetical protein
VILQKKVNKITLLLSLQDQNLLCQFAGFQLFYINPLEEDEASLAEKLDLLVK